MRIIVQVKLRAKVSRLEPIDSLLGGSEQCFVAYVQAPPVDGKANEEVVRLVSDYFHIRKSNIKIISGQTSTLKIIDIIS